MSYIYILLILLFFIDVSRNILLHYAIDLKKYFTEYFVKNKSDLLLVVSNQN